MSTLTVCPRAQYCLEQEARTRSSDKKLPNIETHRQTEIAVISIGAIDLISSFCILPNLVSLFVTYSIELSTVESLARKAPDRINSVYQTQREQGNTTRRNVAGRIPVDTQDIKRIGNRCGTPRKNLRPRKG